MDNSITSGLDFHQAFVYLMLRVIFGSVFFFQAYDKIFRIKLQNVCYEVYQGSKRRRIPDWFSDVSIYISSYLELTGGFLMVLGLFTLPLLYAFGLHLMMIFVAFGYLQGIWDMKHVFPRLAILVLLLLLPWEWNTFSLDYWLFR